MRVPPRTEDGAPWKQRFRTPAVLWATTAAADPTRGVVCWNRDGAFQMHAWDVRTDEVRQLTWRPDGLATAALSADGRWLLYLEDADGSEVGHHVKVPWEGGEPVDLAPGMAPYASFSQHASADGRVFVSVIADDDGYHLLRADLVADDPAPRVVWSTPHLCFEAFVTADASLAVVYVSSRSDQPRFDLVAIDLTTGEAVAELWDGEGTSIEVAMVSPVPGDQRVAASSDRTGIPRPLLWDPATGERVDLEVPGAEGEVTVAAWSSDGGRLALKEDHRGEHRLWVSDLDAGRAHRLDHPNGTFASLGFGPGGEVVACRETATDPGHVVLLDADTGALLHTAVVAGAPPVSTPWRSVSFPSPDGAPLQAWVAVPEGDGPFPLILETHGGPQAVAHETFFPPAQMWTDHGYAYCSVNYRGSTGFGRDHMEAIWGRPGELEVDDMVAARAWLVAEGIADPVQVLLTGWSYGGYLTLQALGTRPDLWAGGMAGVAVADWVLMHEDSNDILRGYLEGILGGPPGAVPDVYRTGSPSTYVEDLEAPVLIVQGRNDSRCPARQVEAYVARARDAGKRVEVEWFDSGHAAWTDVEATIRHNELMLVFADRVLREVEE